MHRSLAILAALPAVAATQTAATTILHFADTETVMVHPDELVARLRAEAVAPTVAAAQQLVNKAIAAALAQARQTQGIEVSTEGYTTWQPTQPQRWEATQTIVLRSQNGPTLLTLAGDLQARGLAMSDLGWQLSPEAMRKARDQAMREAVSGLHSKADEVAGLLGLRFDSFQRVNLVSSQPTPLPRVMMAMAAGAPPSAVPEDVPVNASAEADAVLVPK